MLRFTITVEGDVQMDRSIEAIETHATDFAPVLHAIAADLSKVSAQQFATEGRYASGGWPALKAAYRLRKAAWVAQGRIINGRPAVSTKILQLTRRLMNSLVNKGDPEHIETVVNNELTWGTKVPYGRFHQKPGPLSKQKQRRFLELPEVKRQAYARALLTFLRTGESGSL